MCKITNNSFKIYAICHIALQRIFNCIKKKTHSSVREAVRPVSDILKKFAQSGGNGAPVGIEAIGICTVGTFLFTVCHNGAYTIEHTAIPAEKFFHFACKTLYIAV